jgi:SnoaL-like domain
MSTQQDPTAVSVARAHVDAWGNHDYERARESLAPEVHVVVTSVDPIAPKVDTTGIDEYMEGLVQFGTGVLPGTSRVSSAIGDETRALLQVTSTVKFGPDAPEMTLHGARLYRLDENGKIADEQVIFFVAPH